MKKLGNLKINPEKLIKSEELISLKGGYGSQCDYYCWVFISGVLAFEGIGCGESAFGAQADCNMQWNPIGGSCQCI